MVQLMPLPSLSSSKSRLVYPIWCWLAQVVVESGVYVQVMAIQEFPVQAAICSPADGTTVEVGEVTVSGYAMSGGGRGIQRVDVTLDGGRTWHGARLHAERQPPGRQWAWTTWEADVPLPANARAGQSVEIAVKATDTSHNTQPESDIGVWNIRGLLENRWHRIHVIVSS